MLILGVATNYYYNLIKSKNPVAFFLFNEQTGTTVDDLSDNNTNLTAFGGATIGNAQGPAGIKRSGFCDGTNDYFYTGSASATYAAITPNSNWTMECWVKPNQASGFGGLYSLESGLLENRVAIIYLQQSNGNILVETGLTPSTTQILTAAQNWNDNAWHYVVVTSTNGGAEKLYVDNVERASSNTARATGNSNKGIISGLFWAGTNPAKINITGVALYDKVLTTNEMTDHWNAGRAV